MDYVEAAVARFREMTTADGACVGEIRLQPNLQVGLQEPAGRYRLRSHTIALDHTLLAVELYAVTLHELCHGMVRQRPWLQDSFETYFSEPPDGEGDYSGVAYHLDYFVLEENFAKHCEAGAYRGSAGLLGALERRCDLSLRAPAERYIDDEVFDAGADDPLAALGEGALETESYSLTELLGLEPGGIEYSARIGDHLAFLVRRDYHDYELVRVDRWPARWSRGTRCPGGRWDPEALDERFIVRFALLNGVRESVIVMDHREQTEQALRFDCGGRALRRVAMPDLEDHALILGGVVGGDRAWISDPDGYDAIVEWDLRTGAVSEISLGDDELVNSAVWGTPDALVSYARRGDAMGLVTVTPDGPAFTEYNNLADANTMGLNWLPDGRMLGRSSLEWTGLPGDLWQVYDPATGESTVVLDGCDDLGPYGPSISLPSGVWVVDVKDYTDYQLTRLIVD